MPSHQAVPSHQTVALSRGRHDGPEEGACVMELASMLAGEPFSDSPRAVCPVLAAFLRSYNDGVDDARRLSLYALAAMVVGTDGDRRTERRRLKRCRERVLELRGAAASRADRFFMRVLWTDTAVACAAAFLEAGAHEEALAFVEELAGRQDARLERVGPGQPAT